MATTSELTSARNTKLTLSPKGIKALKSLEGLRLKAYQDQAGIWTVGYGQTAGVGPKTYLKSEKDAHDSLVRALPEYERAVRELVKVPLEQHEFDALVLFVYNLGRGALYRSSLLMFLNAGHKDRAAKEFPRWVKVRIGGTMQTSNGLVKRRAIEQDMFKYGRYPDD